MNVYLMALSIESRTYQTAVKKDLKQNKKKQEASKHSDQFVQTWTKAIVKCNFKRNKQIAVLIVSTRGCLTAVEQ